MLDKREIVNKTISILYDGKGLNEYDRSSVMELRDQASLAIDLQAEVDRLKAERRWVPVGERLPENCPDLHRYQETHMTVYTVWVQGVRHDGTNSVGLANRLILRKTGIDFIDRQNSAEWYDWHWDTTWREVFSWFELPEPEGSEE